jgi:uncharacterized delta-60 repeat protein
LLTAGDLDPTFGVGGKVLTDFMGPLGSTAYAAVAQPDGKIVVAGNAGSTIDSQFFSHFALARFNPDGSLDPGFGISGRVSTDFGTSHDAAKAVAIQADGKIVAVGSTFIINTGTAFAVARLNTNGSLDSTFGQGGKVVTTFSGGGDASGVAIQPDGKIVVIGGSNAAQLARYNVDGFPCLCTSLPWVGSTRMEARTLTSVTVD